VGFIVNSLKLTWIWIMCKKTFRNSHGKISLI